jgi:acylglycerol lipase
MSHHEEPFEANDGLLLYEHCWLPEQEAAAVVVIVHGICEHGGRYARLADDLNRRGYAVYALDLRGHGRSQGDRVLVRAFDQYVDDVQSLLSRVAAQQPGKPLFLLGHSMGGLIAASLATRQPPGVRGLILSAPAIMVGGEVFPVLRRLAWLASAVWPTLRLVRLGCRFMSRDPAVIKAFENDPLVFHGRFPVRTGAEILRAAKHIQTEAGRITLPMLILQGTRDIAADPKGSRLLLARAGSDDKTLRLYTGLYHELFSEPERDSVVADMADWLDERR